jgi:hypothetical protein
MESSILSVPSTADRMQSIEYRTPKRHGEQKRN